VNDVPHTTEEIATLLERLATDQGDLTLARQLREWAQQVKEHGNFALRARAASIQAEIYQTIEEQFGAFQRSLDGLRDVLNETHLIAQENQQRHDAADVERHALVQKVVDLASVLEQVRTRLIAIGADLAARPSAEEIARRMSQVDNHEERIGQLEGASEQEAAR